MPIPRVVTQMPKMAAATVDGTHLCHCVAVDVCLLYSSRVQELPMVASPRQVHPGNSWAGSGPRVPRSVCPGFRVPVLQAGDSPGTHTALLHPNLGQWETSVSPSETNQLSQDKSGSAVSRTRSVYSQRLKELDLGYPKPTLFVAFYSHTASPIYARDVLTDLWGPFQPNDSMIY